MQFILGLFVGAFLGVVILALCRCTAIAQSNSTGIGKLPIETRVDVLVSKVQI
ncbi:MAG: hypothetical protein AAGU11_10700 [Syntrophobacteraceae bacterium]